MADVDFTIGADSKQAENAFTRVGDAGQKAAYEVAGAVEKIHGKMESVNKLFEKMAGALALGFAAEKVIESARHIAEYADEVDKSSQKTGIAAERIQGLQFAAKMSDISAQGLNESLKKLAKAMEGAGSAGNKGAEAFAAVGIKASDLKGMKTDDALLKIADAFANSQDGAGKAAVAMELFGKSGTDMIPFLNKGSASINELMEQAQKMGLVMSGDALSSASQLDDQFKLMDAQIEGLQRRASLALVPAFLQITNAFSESTQQGGVLSGVFDGLGQILILITKTASYLVQALHAFGITIGATSAAVVAAVSGDFAAAKQIMDMGNDDIHASARKFEQFRETLEKPINVPKQPKVESEGKGDLSLRGGGASSRVSEWRAELEAKKIEERNFFKDSLADDEAFWQSKLLLAKGNAKETAAVQHELYAIQKTIAVQKFNDEQESLKTAMAAARIGSAERIALATESARRVGETYGFESREYMAAQREIKKAEDDAAKEKQKLATMEIERVRNHNVALIGMERDRLGLQKSLGQISDLEEIAALKKLKEQEYLIEMQAQQQKIDLMKEEGVAKQQQLDELAKMKDKHDAEMMNLDDKRVMAIKKNWSDALGVVSSAFEQSINGMIQGTQTWTQAMNKMGQSILAEAMKRGVTWVTNELANILTVKTAHITAEGAKTAATVASTSTGMVANVATSTAVITNDAAVAGAGITANTAPMAGPFAIGIGAAGMAAVLALIGNLKSSAGGEWRVPTDRLNLVHKDETILPAHIAGPLRDMVSGGGVGGGETIHLHTQGGDFVHKNDVAKLLRQMKRNFVEV